MKIYGIIGYPLTHTFSPEYFNHRFRNENLRAVYNKFPLKDISVFSSFINSSKELCGLNVTTPYKTEIIHFLDKLEDDAKLIRAVNVIKIIRTTKKIQLIGYNTDIFGFEGSIKNILPHHRKALVLGTGGAAAAVCSVLEKYGITYSKVSRNPATNDVLAYQQLDSDTVMSNTLIINATPAGMFPDLGQCPDFPYQFLTQDHFLYDLIYNPEESIFLKKGKEAGAGTKNGMEMLILQAEKTWEIWNK